MSRLKFAVIGCGAVADVHHLPALVCSDQVEVAALVDPALARAREMAEKYKVPTVVDDYRKVIGKVDAAIVGVPNRLHARVSTDLLQAGIHVLVEKPMALSANECEEMIGAAARAEATLAVGLEFRFFSTCRFLKQALENRMLGKIVSFDFRQGEILRWPFRSDYVLHKGMAGGGTLIDFGSHVLDLLLWWLGDYAQVEYYDDAQGGVDANCEIHLQLASGASGIVELSRNRKLRNTYIIQGELGTLEIDPWNAGGQVRLKLKDHNLVLSGRPEHQGMNETYEDAYRWQLADFVAAIKDHRQAHVSGQKGQRHVELIETCYAAPRLLEQPWMALPSAAAGVLARD